MAKKTKKHPGGRPPKYKTPEEMQAKIDAYFKTCEGEVLTGDDGLPVMDKWGNVITVHAHPPTVTGLALALGFSGRTALLDYQAKPKFVDTVTRAKSRVEAYAEERLYDREGARGAEFSLRHNFKWGAEKQDDTGDASGVIVIPDVGEEVQP